ncbi:glycine--tRNA ligase [Botrimarina sp.]|uniref:glycine--tRNA ligase n=1 Tax=Botrimarina sp. TaxID=2795802 RepID=UPI0032EC1134
MEKLVSLCRRRGFLFQSSEIYGGLNGFWDYGPLGVELKRNVKDAWWRDMVTAHDDLDAPPGAPSAYDMTGLDCTIIMHPQVWKCSGHFDLFADMLVECKESKKRYRYDQVRCRWVDGTGMQIPGSDNQYASQPTRYLITTVAENEAEELEKRALKLLKVRAKDRESLKWDGPVVTLDTVDTADFDKALAPEATKPGTFGEPRPFNLMFESYAGAIQDEKNKVFLRPETAQGIFVNFKNVIDSSRVKVPVGIAQIGKSFRNEITPRNFTFRSREFEQMEIEFFCHPSQSQAWYKYWRDRRMKWWQDLGLAGERLILRDHDADELSHYSTGTADIEYAFPFLPEGEYGELEGIAHRGDFDLRSHMEGKLDPNSNPLTVQLGEDGKPLHKGSGRDLTYRDDVTNERFTPHVIEPSAGADRGTLALLCEAYTEDTAPDDKGKEQTRVVMKFHPRVAPIKAAVFPLVKKDGMPEIAKDLYRALKKKFPAFYDEKGAVGRRYRRQDEAGTPYCLTVDGETVQHGTVTLRDRDSLEQVRIKLDDVVEEIERRVTGP